MYCPRCGSANTDTQKFCRQCGLALQQVSAFVATGGTQQFVPPVNALTNAPLPPSGFSPQQKMILSILGIVLGLPVLAILGDSLGAPESLIAVWAVLIPFGIAFAIMYFRNQAKQLAYQQQVAQSQFAAPAQMAASLPQAQALPPHAQSPQAIGQPYFQVNQPDSHTQPGQNTNPFGSAPQSVIEDETRKLPQ